MNPNGTNFSQDRSISVMSEMSVNTGNYNNNSHVNGGMSISHMSGGGSNTNSNNSNISNNSNNNISLTSKPFTGFTDHSIGSYSKGPYMGSSLSVSAPWIPEGALSSTVHGYGNRFLGTQEELIYKKFEKGGYTHDNSESRAAILRQNTARASFEGYSKQSSSIKQNRGIVSLNPFQEKKMIK